MLFLLPILFAACSACAGVAACTLSLVCWRHRRDALAKPGRATALCVLTQSVVIGVAVTAFWWLVPFAVVAVYAWRRRRRDAPPTWRLHLDNGDRLTSRALPSPPPRTYAIKKLE
jgi:hypothetical protein